MNLIMDTVLGLISNYGSLIIIISGIGLLVWMVNNTTKLAKEKERIEELTSHKNKKYTKNIRTHELEEEDDESSFVTPDTIRRHERDFNKLCSTHNAQSQLIPVFPLLGILGTVAGLMLNTGDVDKMTIAISTALYTTFWGLIVAIVLKVIDAFFPSKIIYDANTMLDDYDKKIDIAELFDESPKKT